MSRINIVYEFLNSLVSLYDKQVPLELKHLTSDEIQELQKDFDYIIVSDIKKPIRIDSSIEALIFYQKNPSIQLAFDEALEMTSWTINRQTIDFQFNPLISSDQNLLDRSFKVDNSLTIKAPNSQVLAYALNDPLIIRKGKHIFSAISFTDSEFDGVLHPYFPVFLYRLILNRLVEVNLVKKTNNLSNQRLVDITAIEKNILVTSNQSSDLSKLFLVFLLLFSLVELGLILSLQNSLSDA